MPGAASASSRAIRSHLPSSAGAALVTGKVLEPRVLPDIEAGDVQGGRGGVGGHAPGAAPYPVAAGAGRIEGLARRRDAQAVVRLPVLRGGQDGRGRGHLRPRIHEA
ncbi:hypothetical protein [Streptomyces cyaneofuscatus]|uniref:hypothetical protein n=1 Tax=Streptomyces cyaneofuscatus TaxID=66883 RepID=UPI002F91B807|nr:hypothetical protein OG973_36725 [Streptomyces cyaneofuscatus]